jgi:CubicO group peptidase (beta-lactamase class C family)
MKKLPVWLTILMMAFMCASLTAEEHNPNSADFNSLNHQFAELVQARNIQGISAAIVYNDRAIWRYNAGYAEANRTILVTSDTPFWIASITKTFVGLSYLHLAEKESLDLNALAGTTPNFSRLCNWLAGTSIPFAQGLDCNQAITIKHILHHQVNHPIGESFMYNPIMYSRLSRHLEHLYGDGVKHVEGRHNFLGQSIDKYILSPAGMNQTMASMWDESKLKVFFDLADGFVTDEYGKRRKGIRPDKHIAGGAGVVSSVNDLIKYDIAIRNGTITTPAIKEKLLNPATFKDGRDSPYGYGWYFQSYQGNKLMWHGGWDPEAGFSALMLRIPNQKLTLIVLANSEAVWWGNPLDKAQVHKSAFAKVFLDVVLAQQR